MTSYAILANPGHNRIYFEAAMQTAYMELSAIAQKYNVKLSENDKPVEGLPAHLHFDIESDAGEDFFKAVGASSMFYAMFKIENGGLLSPVKISDFHVFDESMNSILRYTGKTNEQFTRMMVNLALCACKTGSEKIKLLDPMCGKGTTLYEGMIRGFDTVGVEINSQWFSEMQTYIVKYLQTGRYKHLTSKERRSAPKGKKIAELFTVKTAATKLDFENKNTISCEIFNADTRISDMLIKKNSCDILVSDLPYGVQHASKSKSKEQDTALSRSPFELLKESLPAWRAALKKGGAMVLSYNEFTLRYDGTAKLLEDNGFTVLRESPYFGYKHRVDQAIVRDLIVAVKN